MKKSFSIILLSIFLLAPLIPEAQTAVQNNFYVNSQFDAYNQTKVSATRRYTSDTAYFYVEDKYYNGLTSTKRDTLALKLSNLGAEFDSNIYPKLREFYGSEWKPGIDNDERITILITEMQEGVNGYFLPRDQKSRNEEPQSNQKEMFYLSVAALNSNFAKAHIAHEFTHLIEYNEKTRKRGVKEFPWLSEALAEYAPTLLGYNSPYEGSYLETRVNDFVASPTDALTLWDGQNADFASVNLFMHYIVGRWGEGILGKITQTSLTGVDAVENILPEAQTFKEVFTAWHISNYVNGTSNGGSSEYSYTQPYLNYANLRTGNGMRFTVVPKRDISSRLSQDQATANRLQFTPGILGFTGTNTLKIEFESSPATSNFSVPLVITDIDGKTQVKFMDTNSAGDGTYKVLDFGASVISVTVIPVNFDKTMSINGQVGYFTINVSMQEDSGGGQALGESIFADGALVREAGSPDVYIIKIVGNKKFKRLILNPDIFNSYGHLKWENVIDTQEGALADYTLTNLIRQDVGTKVYRVASTPDADMGEKSWLNMSASSFESCGYDWDSIYIVNSYEIAETFYPSIAPATSCQ